jgi:GntR family transcriptional regulator, rspAB operon transcriptional repressor
VYDSVSPMNTDLFAVQALDPRRSVVSLVVDVLRELIVTEELKGGTRLTQRELADRLQVSQTPVRAGLSLLERDGFITIEGKGRALVRHLTREDLEELYAMRRGLEGLAAKLGAERITEDRLIEMRALLEQIKAAGAREDIKQYLECRWKFHAACYEATERKRLVADVERLFWRGERYHRLLLSERERCARSLGWYERFLSSCEARHGAAAELVIDESTRWAVSQLAPLLPSEVDVV